VLELDAGGQAEVSGHWRRARLREPGGETMWQAFRQRHRRSEARGEPHRHRDSLNRWTGEDRIERAALAMGEVAKRGGLAFVGNRRTGAKHEAVMAAQRRQGRGRRERQSQHTKRIGCRQPGTEPGAAKAIEKGGASLHGRKWRRFPSFVKPRIAASLAERKERVEKIILHHFVSSKERSG